MSSVLAVVDLAAPTAPLALPTRAEAAKVVFLWRGTPVGELLVELRGERRPLLQIPPEIVLGAREVELTARLRPALAPFRDAAAPSISVVICTLGRPEPLAACLASLARLRTAPHEVVVVNNDPADGRPRELAGRFGARVADEPRRGLSAARNTGIRSSSGELIAFIDDDCEVDPGWLDGLAADFEDVLVAAVVGYVGPAELETGAQWLFEAQGGFERRFRRERFDGALGGPWAAAGVGDGNSFFRREVLEAVGGFSEALGPGTPGRSAQDAELFYRILERGRRIQFAPARVAWHSHRRELDDLAATLEGYTTGLSAHAARALVARRDLAALRLWIWWGRHYFPGLVADARRDPRPGRRRLLGVQARGALLGPLRGRAALRPGAQAPSVAIARPPSSVPVAVSFEVPGISVVLASRNRRDSLVRTLRGLRDQVAAAESFELVIVLDGSADGSLEAVRDLAGELPLRVEAQEHAGLAVARNRGVQLSDRPLVLFLDDDIVPEPGLVAEHARAHAAGEDAIVMGEHPPVVDERRWWAQLLRAWWEDHFRRKRAPGWQPTFVDYCDGNSSLSRELFDRLGGFDAAFSGGRRQDWELGIRALAAGVELRMAPAARGAHHADASFAAALRSARQEGRYDVTLARMHPLAAGRLRLSQPAAAPSLRRRIGGPAAARLGDAHWIALADRLERARARAAWARVTRLATKLAYAKGVCEALAGEPEAALLGAVRRGEDLLRLDVDPAGAPLGRVGSHPGRVTLALPGGAELPALEPELGWDAEALLECVARALAHAESPEPSTLALS